MNGTPRGGSEYGGEGEVVAHQPGSLSPFKISEIVEARPDGALVVRYPGGNTPTGVQDLSSDLYQFHGGQPRASATPTGLSPLLHPEAIGRAVGKPADTHANPRVLRYHDAADLQEPVAGRHPIVSQKLKRTP